MTVHQFTSLTKAQQQDLVLKNGAFLSERADGPFKVMLYQMDEFYVEVYFSNLSIKPSWFTAFDDTDELMPYLETIDVSMLLQEASY